MTDKEENLTEVIEIDEKTEDKTESETVNTSLSHIATAGIESTNENITANEVPIRKEIELGLKFIVESNLTDEQKKLTLQIYESVKSKLKDTITDEAINETIKVTKIIGSIVTLLENTKVDEKIPSGNDKKAVAIQLGRNIIKEILSDNTNILVLYDTLAEPLLETMIDVSKVVNTVIMEATKKCCPGLFELFRLMRRK